MLNFLLTIVRQGARLEGLQRTIVGNYRYIRKLRRLSFKNLRDFVKM